MWAAGIRVLGDIWDPRSEAPIVPVGFNPRQRDRAKKSIQLLINTLPGDWTALLTPATTWSPENPRREDVFVGARPIIDINFTRAYRAIIEKKLKGINFNERTKAPLKAFKEKTGVRTTPERLWHTARVQFDIPKADNFLWRLLHQKVITERSLDWIPAPRQDYPIHRCDLTIYHIFIECTVASAVWEELGAIWLHVDRTFFISLRSVNEFIACMAMSSVLYKPRRRWWLILYQTAIWSLWKVYLSYLFDLSHRYWSPEVALGYYKEMIKNLILTDKILCSNEKYKSSLYNEDAFIGVWGENPHNVKILRGPKCLYRPLLL